ncbi:Uncharacterised protein [Mycobacterium tuberculosis]|uniref:Uncharacterized protein n=1 Tax=Mycobacterium tuberculosis TaxID=1773 RepID=A0A655IW01_MYCTX|nr:Uncharacterised protein [Mycobacterium tuberculosis]COW43629.1 Uncharacterised protein [Mycobacterium tuberculosis]COY04288.1 Uncharacterised protein [Mycobacterium tuberculosis]
MVRAGIDRSFASALTLSSAPVRAAQSRSTRGISASRSIGEISRITDCVAVVR